MGTHPDGAFYTVCFRERGNGRYRWLSHHGGLTYSTLSAREFASLEEAEAAVRGSAWHFFANSPLGYACVAEMKRVRGWPSLVRVGDPMDLVFKVDDAHGANVAPTLDPNVMSSSRFMPDYSR